MTSPEFPKRNYAPRPRKTHTGGHDRPKAEGRVRSVPPRQERRTSQPPPAVPAPPQAPAADTAWEAQAGWYDRLQGDRGDGFYASLILPAVLRQLAVTAGDLVLDVCCGQGVLGRALADIGVGCLGVDASPSLIAAAADRAGDTEHYLVGDARQLDQVLTTERFQAATLVMALQDLDPIAPVLEGIAKVLVPGGRVVLVMTHPVLRIPRRTTWGFDEDTGVQYRRLDGYLSPMRLPIRTHPGQPHDTSATSTFHRPLHAYVNACGAAGLGIISCEELCSQRRGTHGPRFGAEDRAAKEFPVFLVLTAVRLPERPVMAAEPTPG